MLMGIAKLGRGSGFTRGEVEMETDVGLPTAANVSPKNGAETYEPESQPGLWRVSHE